MSNQPVHRVSAPQDQDRDCPSCREKRAQQRQGIRVRQIGRPDPPEARPDQQAVGEFVLQDAQQRLVLNADAMQGAPKWAISMMNEVRNLHIEVIAYGLALMRRGLVTEHEVNQARHEITMEANKAFREMVEQLGRAFKQAPVGQPPAPPHDPRRSPGGK